MRVTRHLPRNQIHFNYSLHQQTLEQIRSAKYLGLTITDNLEWGRHVSEISCKATMTLGFLRCSLALAPRHTKEVGHWLVLSSSVQLLFGIPIMTLRQIRWKKCRRQQPGGPAGDCGTGVASAICSTNSSGHPWRTAG